MLFSLQIVDLSFGIWNKLFGSIGTFLVDQGVDSGNQ